MGTRGLYVFFYKETYYVFYNNMDSYPEALGQILVMMLKMENYSSWGDIIVDQIDNGNYIPRKFIYENYKYNEKEITEEDMEDLKENEEWEIQKFCRNLNHITLLKWNYKPLIKYTQILFPLIETVCPSFDRSIFIFKTMDINSIKTNTEVEWIYIIDITFKTFSVLGGKNDVKFFINSIPYNWIDRINRKKN